MILITTNTVQHLCVWHCSEHFTHNHPFNPHNSCSCRAGCHGSQDTDTQPKGQRKASSTPELSSLLKVSSLTAGTLYCSGLCLAQCWAQSMRLVDVEYMTGGWAE